MDCSPPGSSVHGILQARILQWIQFSSVTPSCLTLCHPTDCSALGLIVHYQLPENAQTHIRWVGDAIQPSHPLSSPSPLAFSLSQHQGLSPWISSLNLVAKALELQLQHQSFQWYSFRIDWFDLLAVQGTLRSLLQHHSSKASILHCSAFTHICLLYWLCQSLWLCGSQ